MSARGWSLGLLASAGLHGIGLAALALTTQPEPVPDQSIPQSRFSIDAAEVRRSRATPQEAPSERATQSDAQSQLIGQGNVPMRAASAQPLEMAALAPQSPVNAPARPALRPAAQSLAPAPRPKAIVATVSGAASALAAEAPAAEVITTASARPATTTAIALSASAVPARPALTSAVSTSATRPASQDLPVQSANSTVTAPIAPTPRKAALTAPETQSTTALPSEGEAPPALPLPAEAQKAALAWSADGNRQLPAASLAAITAFTQAGDLSAETAELRDGIEGILAAVPCARLQTTFVPQTGVLELRGHVPEDALRGPVLAALQAQIGDAIPISDQVLILPRPQCGALAGIANVGLPQSTEQLTNPAVIGADGFARNYTYADGERLILDLTAPDYDAYVYVDYFAADGSVLHLQPNDIVPLAKVVAKSALSVGRARDDQPFLELTVSAPFGQEIAAAFASSVPLFTAPRPIQEPAADYLAALKDRVAEARAADPDFKGEWVYFFISTTPG